MELVNLKDFDPNGSAIYIYGGSRHFPDVYKRNVKRRKCSSFMYIVKGEYLFTYDGKQLYASSGDTVYFPKNSKHTYEVLINDTECVQTEFDITSVKNNDSIVFSKRPIVAIEKNFMDVKNIFSKYYYDLYGKISCSERNLMMADIYTLIYYMADNLKNNLLLNVPKKIKPAVEYINNNYTQKVYTAHLAELCFLSESQMRRIFHSEFGMSPIEYKNNLCIKKACNMLKFTNSSISEIAREVGFGNLCFFSQTFKKITGVSPKQYSLKYRS